jgi:hypothetical protein
MELGLEVRGVGYSWLDAENSLIENSDGTYTIQLYDGKEKKLVKFRVKKAGGKTYWRGDGRMPVFW